MRYHYGMADSTPGTQLPPESAVRDALRDAFTGTLQAVSDTRNAHVDGVADAVDDAVAALRRLGIDFPDTPPADPVPGRHRPQNLLGRGICAFCGAEWPCPFAKDGD